MPKDVSYQWRSGQTGRQDGSRERERERERERSIMANGGAATHHQTIGVPT